MTKFDVSQDSLFKVCFFDFCILKNTFDNEKKSIQSSIFKMAFKIEKSTRSRFWRWEHFGK